jgi:hypothetical protein
MTMEGWIASLTVTDTVSSVYHVVEGGRDTPEWFRLGCQLDFYKFFGHELLLLYSSDY